MKAVVNLSASIWTKLPSVKAISMPMWAPEFCGNSAICSWLPIHCLQPVKNRNALRLCSHPEKGKCTQNRSGQFSAIAIFLSCVFLLCTDPTGLQCFSDVLRILILLTGLLINIYCFTKEKGHCISGTGCLLLACFGWACLIFNGCSFLLYFLHCWKHRQNIRWKSDSIRVAS